MCFGFSDVTEQPVDLGLFFPELSQTLFKFRTFSRGAIFFPLLIFAENAANAGL